MNKILRYSFVALLAMIGLNISAQEVTIDFSGSEDVWGIGTTKLVETNSFTYNGITIKLTGTEGNGYRWYDSGNIILGKQGATLEFPAFDFEVSRIDVEGTSGASAAVKQNIFVGEEEVSTETTGAKSVTNQYNIAEGKQAAGTIYTLKVTSNHNTQITKIMIYKKGSSAKDQAGISWSKASASVTIGGDDNIFPTLNNPNNLTVSYASSKEEVATIDASGAITLVAAGSTTISAIFEGNDQYEASTVTYNLTVKEAEGGGGGGEQTVTEATVAEALAAIDALENGAKTAGDYKVTGYVVEVTEISTEHGNATFTIADAKGGSPVLTVFRAKDANGEDIKNANFVKVDDLVVVQGKLQKYVKNDVVTPELAQGGKVLTINGETAIGTGGDPGPGPEPHTMVGDGSKENPYTVADMKSMTEDQYPAEAVWVKGVIIGSASSATALKEEGADVVSNIAIAESSSETTFIPVALASGSEFRTKLNLVDNPGNKGKEVLLKGKIQKYFSTTGVKDLIEAVFEGETISGITNITADQLKNAPAYNVAGQRVNEGYKGLIIKGGKKVVMK